jgi:membrane-associated phospholipid phosphatase
VGAEMAGTRRSWEGSLHRRTWLYLSAACGLSFAILAVPILMRQNWPGDWLLVQWALGHRSPGWTLVMQAITFAGSSAVGAGICVGASVVWVIRERRLTRLAFLPLVAVLGAAPLNLGLRFACGRLRPMVTYIPHLGPELRHPFQRWSFPSGHAMTVTICYGVLVCLLARASPHWRKLAIAGWALWLAVVGFSRVYLGVHWPTDVLAGYAAGGFWLCLCIAWLAGPWPASGGAV